MNKKKLIKELWKVAEDALYSLYTDTPSIRILNRFYSEKSLFFNTDAIILWNIATELRIAAKHKGEITNITSTDSSCFTAYLMGASDINPLELHYFCPSCRRVEFIDKRALPWDVAPRICECSCNMHADGFDIPYVMHKVKSAPSIQISIAVQFISAAESIIRNATRGLYRVVKLKAQNPTKIVFVLLPFEESENFGDYLDSIYDSYCDYPKITFIFPSAYSRAKDLSEATGVDFDEVASVISDKYPFDERILSEFRSCNIDGIAGFDLLGHPRAKEIRDALKTAEPRSYYDLLKYIGCMHGTNAWWDNAESLIKNKICSIGDIPAHKDDVFMLVLRKLREKGLFDCGIAYDVASKVRSGTYAKLGMTTVDHATLESLGLDEWFISYIRKIQYASFKAKSLGHLRIALAFMWFKIHYPREFKNVCEVKNEA